MPTAPTEPVTEFVAGGRIRLSWESNGTWFEVYEKANPKPVYAGAQTFCDLTGVLTDTTFFVVGEMAGGQPAPGGSPEGEPTPSGPPEGDAPEGFAPVYLYADITVTVSNPALTPGSVACAGPVSAASLSASGAITGATLAASGGVTAGSLAASAGVTAASVAASGQLSGGSVAAAGQVSGASLAVTGPSTLNGRVAAPGGLTVGNWTISQDSGGNLVISNGRMSLQITNDRLNVGDRRVIRDADPIGIWSFKRSAWLNATLKGSPNTPSSFHGWTYWQGNGDSDSNLQMRYRTP